MATWKTLMLQDSATPLMEQLLFFHDHTLLILTIVTVLVSQLLLTLFFNKLSHRFLLEGQLIELIWTILPAVILIFIALPSLRLIYLLDEVDEPSITVKAIGHQWYWSYEYTDFETIDFDSYLIPLTNLKMFHFRLLDVDNRLIVPYKIQIRLIVTSADVIHSWTVPSLGVKIDATPGRLNQTSFIINRPGLFFGQCSEICGINHSFMPIVVESVAPTYFAKWITQTLDV
uniref:Cytochrome c oxidase subunit 2 n=1 Tax=Obrium sp. NS-2015 TaxID=1776756 RepID=A0A0U4JWU3_9CUCU|nr:cytochrome c oxidase subunit II [Obrium sp. NS-2015]